MREKGGWKREGYINENKCKTWLRDEIGIGNFFLKFNSFRVAEPPELRSISTVATVVFLWHEPSWSSVSLRLRCPPPHTANLVFLLHRSLCLLFPNTNGVKALLGSLTLSKAVPCGVKQPKSEAQLPRPSILRLLFIDPSYQSSPLPANKPRRKHTSKCVSEVTSLTVLPFLPLALDGNELLASRPRRFTHGGRAPRILYIGDWVSFRSDLEAK